MNGAGVVQATFTGKETDEESTLQYFGARYMDNNIGRFVSVDPVALVLHNPNKLKEITGQELQDILADPQALHAYAYSRNNPIVLVDQNGEFAGDFGRDMASGQRQIGSFFHNAGNYVSSQGGFINKVSGFVSNSLGDVADNVADMYDPDQNAGTRVLSLGFATLDVGTGGKGKTITKIGRVTKEMKALDIAKRPIQALDDINGFTEHGLKEMKAYGLTLDHIKDAVVNTSKLTKRVDELGRVSYRYVSEKAVVNFNKFKEFITGWPK